MSSISTRARERFGMDSPIFDNYSEEIFSMFLDLCQSQPLHLTNKSADPALIQIIEEWQCPEILSKLEIQILQTNDVSLQISFLSMSMSKFPQILSEITTNFTSYSQQYPQLLSMKPQLLSAIYKSNKQSYSGKEIISQLISIQNRLQDINEKKQKTDAKIESLQKDISACKEKMLISENQIKRKQNELKFLSKREELKKEDSNKKLNDVKYLLQQLNAEYVQISSLEQEIQTKKEHVEEYRKQTHEIEEMLGKSEC